MPKYALQLILWCASCFVLPSATAQVTARFTASDTAGCAPLVVNFTNTSTGATSYSWNFDNGTPSSVLESTSTPFTTPGTYVVKLTAYNGGDSSSYSMTIRVYSVPTVSFTATSATSVCPGTPVSFTSTSTPGSWGSLTYTWNFGDGGSSTLNAPAHAFSLPGNYNVTLYATNVKGCINSATVSNEVHVYTPPAISFSAPSQFCRPPAIAPFINTTTGTGTLSYTWKYGDGMSGTGTSPTHTYTAPGSYTVMLAATDGNGCKDSLSKPAYIVIGNQTAVFTASPTTVCIGAPVTFTNTSVSYISSNWSFGDGLGSPDISPVHSYAAAGSYTVRLISYNGGICYDTTTQTVTVQPSPTGNFTQSPAEPCAPPVAVTFTASIPAGCTVSWIFSDTTTASGITGTGTPFVYTFPVSEVCNIDMIIANSIGCTDTVVKMDTIYNLIWNLLPSAPFGCSPLGETFYSQATSIVKDLFLPVRPDSLFVTYPYSITSYNWNFGDGSPNSTLAIPIHTYSAVGSYTYTSTCSIITANGCSATASYSIMDGVTPVASFTMSPTHVCAGGTSEFGCTSTSVIDQYYWNFGDLGFINGLGAGYRTVTHVDSVPGVHTVTLAVYDNGCVSTPVTMTDTVDSPNAEIVYAFECIPENGISFTDASLGDSSRTWLFGDGTTSTLSNPVHVFPDSSIYPVELATYNSLNGCRDTTIADVNLAGPSFYFTGDTLNRCLNTATKFTSKVLGTNPVLGYRWYDNGALVDSVDANLIYTFHTRGLQTISLVIEDYRTCLDTFSLANYVNVAQPIVDYSISPGSGCAPLPVSFTDLSTDVAGAPVKKYSWSFGDGTTTTITNPAVSHTYTASGIYTIKEIVTDTFQCADSLSTSTLSINKPVAMFSVARNVCTNTNVPFNNSSTGYTSVLWLFGDGTTSTVLSPVHVYTTAGVYTASLVVYSPLGCSDTGTFVNYITVSASPVASFYMSDSFAICPPLNVTFFNTSTGATSYYWNLGDSTFSYLASPGDIYTLPGIYTVQEVAVSGAGCTDTATGHAKIFGYPGSFSYTPTSGCSPLSVHFSSVFAGVSSVIWDFDDGTTLLSGSDTVSHTYFAAGAYIPKVILADTTGCTSISTGADTIKADTVAASFTMAPSSACQSMPTTFSNTSDSYFSSIASQSWVFAPGSGSMLADPVYIFTISGTFPVALSVTDRNGCSSVITTNVVVSALPTAITGASTLCAGAANTLSDTGSGTWSISPAGIATIGAASGIVIGVSHGTATVTYTSATGCAVETTVTVNSSSAGPITGASSICAGSTVVLSDITSGGVWSSSNDIIATVGSLTGIVTGISPGTVTITYSPVGACPVTKMLTVAGLPAPISGASTLCAGGTTLETDGLASGTWSSSNTAIATIGTSGGLVSGVAPGTAIITYFPGGTCTADKLITVNALPAVITGSPGMCIGSATSLSDATSGGTWSSSNTAIAIPIAAGTGSISGVATGTATISYIAGGCAVTDVVTVNPSPDALGGVSICVGSTAMLTDLPGGGTWSSGSTGIASIGETTGIVTGVATGTATVAYSLPTGCAVSAAIIVESLPDVITGVPEVCLGYLTSLGDATTGGAWSSSNMAIATITNTGSVTGVSGGPATISYTSIATGCAATRLVTIVAVPAITGVSDMCAYSSGMDVSDAITGGTWTSTSVTVSSAGVVTSYAASSATLTYTIPMGCYSVYTFTVRPTPGPITGTDRFCNGLTTTLSDATTGGAWHSSDPVVASVTPSGSLSGLSAGTAIISYVLTTGCLQTDTITIDSILAASAISGLSTVCAGSMITLTCVPAGGVWGGSNGDATILAGEILGISAGMDTISYTVSNTCGTVLATRTITINPQPEAGSITGPSTVCVGDSILLTDAATGGVWSSGHTVSVSNGWVSGLWAGMDTIAYTVTNSCGLAAVTMPVTVNALLNPDTIGATGSVCINATLTLIDTATGGVWSSSDNLIISITGAGVIRAISAGVDTIRYSLTNSCGTASANLVITVNALTAAGIITGADSVCVGETDTLTGTPSGGAWSSSNGSTASVTSGIVSVFLAGADTILYTITGECGPAVASYPIVVLSQINCDTRVAGSQQNQAVLKVWPNPNDGTFSILLSSDVDEPVHVTVTNVVGEKVKELAMITNKETGILLGAAAGVYFISASTGQGSYVVKVVVNP